MAHNLCEITIEPGAEFRFELQHIVTLSVRRSGGASHADVCFNPRNSGEFAVVDQSSCWSTWRIKSVSKKTNAWTLEAHRSGRCTASSLDATGLRFKSEASRDGWGAVRWIRDAAGLLICGRKHVGAAELRGIPNQLPLPEFGLSTTADWILDVRQSPTDLRRIFILTSSRVLWAHLGQNDAAGSDRSLVDARMLLAWTHFRDEHDISLSLQVVDLWPSMWIPLLASKAVVAKYITVNLIVLYSRRTDLKTAFTFEPGNGVSRIASSACDPYILPGVTCSSQPASTCATLLLRAVPFQMAEPTSYEQLTTAPGDNGIIFLRCWTLTGALSLHECFLTHSLLGSGPPLQASRSLGRVPMTKSAYMVQDGLIVANGLLDSYVHDTAKLHRAGRSRPDISGCRSGQFLSITQSPRTINLEGLAKDMNTVVSVSIAETLQLVSDRIHKDHPNAGAPGIISL